MKRSLILPLCLLAGCTLIPSSSIFAQGGPPVFEHRMVPRSRPTPISYHPPSRPIPRPVLMGGAVALALIAAFLLYFAAKAWRASNIFGRKYRLPSPETAAVRFGGNRSGGLMATIEPAKDKMDA